MFCRILRTSIFLRVATLGIWKRKTYDTAFDLAEHYFQTHAWQVLWKTQLHFYTESLRMVHFSKNGWVNGEVFYSRVCHITSFGNTYEIQLHHEANRTPFSQ